MLPPPPSASSSLSLSLSLVLSLSLQMLDVLPCNGCAGAKGQMMEGSGRGGWESLAQACRCLPSAEARGEREGEREQGPSSPTNTHPVCTDVGLQSCCAKLCVCEQWLTCVIHFCALHTGGKSIRPHPVLIHEYGWVRVVVWVFCCTCVPASWSRSVCHCRTAARPEDPELRSEKNFIFGQNLKYSEGKNKPVSSILNIFDSKYGSLGTSQLLPPVFSLYTAHRVLIVVEHFNQANWQIHVYSTS